MTDAARKVLAEFSALSDDDQRWLTEVLVERLRDTEDEGERLSDDWKGELTDRIGEIERGDVELVDADSITAELRERYG